MNTFRGAYAVVGLGFLIIVGALLYFNHDFTKKGDTVQNESSVRETGIIK